MKLRNLLHETLLNNNIESIKSPGNTDKTIASEAIRNDTINNGKKTVVVSEDVDGPVILTALAGELINDDNLGAQEIYFLKPQSSNGTIPQKIFSNNSINLKYSHT